ncbi:LacI family DNA-binding transcriptional regulator [Oscillospiraceae bacterium PP1C4]
MNSWEIAKLSGVSRSTVSRVINNYDNVPDATRKRVQEIIDKHGYTPNNSARNLVGKPSKIVGLFFIEEDEGGSDTIHSSPFYSEFLSYCADELKTKGYQLLISVVKDFHDAENIKSIVDQKLISGSIIMGDLLGDDLLYQLSQRQTFTMLVNQKETIAYDNIILLNTENYGGAYAAVEKLIKCGHVKIAHIAGNIEKISVKQRMNGYLDCLKDHGIAVNKNYIVHARMHKHDGGYHAMQTLLEENKGDYPTAVFATNDLMAVGAIKALKEMDISVPNVVSIFGYDNVEMSSFTIPSLSTVDTKVSEVVHLAVDHLIDAIESGRVAQNILTQSYYKLIIRDSVKTIR